MNVGRKLISFVKRFVFPHVIKAMKNVALVVIENNTNLKDSIVRPLDINRRIGV